MRRLKTEQSLSLPAIYVCILLTSKIVLLVSSVRMNQLVVLLLPALLQVRAGLLGYGTGEGSCAAAPFRAKWVKWGYGCPAFAPCCSEYGYCRPLVSFTVSDEVR